MVSIVNNPPAANGLSEDVGAWIGLAGAILIGIGAILSQRRISVVVSSSPRERSGSPRDRSTESRSPATEPFGHEDETRPDDPGRARLTRPPCATREKPVKAGQNRRGRNRLRPRIGWMRGSGGTHRGVLGASRQGEM